MIELTEAQRKAVMKGEPVRVSAPEIGGELVLLSAATYEECREIVEDERARAAIAKVALGTAVQWAQENPY